MQGQREGRALRLSCEEAPKEARCRVLRLCETVPSQQPGLKMKLRQGRLDEGVAARHVPGTTGFQSGRYTMPPEEKRIVLEEQRKGWRDLHHVTPHAWRA